MKSTYEMPKAELIKLQTEDIMKLSIDGSEGSEGGYPTLGPNETPWA